MPQKASENSSKSPHPVCDQRGSRLPSTSVLACDSPGWGSPRPPQRGRGLVMLVPRAPARPRPGGRPGPLLCQTPFLPAGPPCTVAMATPLHVSRACCSHFVSLWGQSHFREAPGAARQKGDSPEAPRGPGPRPGLDPGQRRAKDDEDGPGWPGGRWEAGVGGQERTERTEIRQWGQVPRVSKGLADASLSPSPALGGPPQPH